MDIRAIAAGLALAMAPQLAAAQTAVRAEAEVTVSNGRNFIGLMRYAAPDDAEYVRRLPDGENRYVVAADGVWLINANGREKQSDDVGLWALSHNFHAQIFAFDALNGGSTRHAFVEPGCDCEELRGKRAALGFGIEYLSLIVERAGGRARKLLIHRKDAAPVVSVYSDWRASGDRQLPFAVDLDDGEDRYAFRFTSIAVE